MKIVSPLEDFKVRINEGQRVLFLMVISFRPWKSMQGGRFVSFFSTKKKLNPSGEEEGWMMPAARESLI